MENIRIIPSLLLQNKKLVKTIRFKNPSYIGDPINTLRIFNNLFVDEIILLDITHSSVHNAIDFDYLKMLTAECFLPLCYGGRVSTIEIAAKIFSIGIEKISVQTAAINNLKFVKELSKNFGSQSIVGAIDYKNVFLKGATVVPNNKKKSKYLLIDYAQALEDNGAGELLITSIMHEGMMSGYDLDNICLLSEKISIPIILNGGAGSLEHIKEAYRKTGINAFAASSLFIYSGTLRGILINYPARTEIMKIFSNENLVEL